MKVKQVSVLKNTYPFLNIVSKMKPGTRKNILKEVNGDIDVYKSLREIAVNTLQGNVPLKASIKKKLKPHMKTLHQFSKHKSNKCSCKKRNKLIQQGSGFLPLLIPAIATIVASFMNKKD